MQRSMLRSARLWAKTSTLLLAGLALAGPFALAVEQPPAEGAKALVFQADELYISDLDMPAEQVADTVEQDRAARLGSAPGLSHFDLRTGRFATLAPATPLLPGRGVGNHLSWSGLGASPPASVSELRTLAWDAFTAWLDAHSAVLRVDRAELVDTGRVTVLGPDYLQIYSPRRVAGYPVRGSHVTATIKYGNLLLFGAYRWADVEDADRSVRLDRQQATAVLAAHVGSFALGKTWKDGELMWVPVASANVPSATAMGNGLEHKLVWVLRPTFGEEHGRYEALVDAVDGKVLAIEDANHNVASTRSVEGGVYPVSNDGVDPDGDEQPDYPMPFARVTTPSGTVTTDVGGNLPACVDGSISHNLTGQYMTMSDACGAPSLSGTGSLDWGVSGGTDCTTPGTGGAGNTHSSRTGFYELNMIKAMARSQVPNNTWLRENLTSNMNINLTCNAFWNGSTVNFYRSGGGCFNTGELPGVFDHEWGHGMDDNDGVPTVSSPGEGIADIYGSLRLDDSCLGRHFRATNCGGYGNACTACTGVRDIDWAKHAANLPFTMANADACAIGNSNGPCGGSVHCESQVYSQAVWDLWNRDLVAAPFNRTLDVARELATQLSYRGGSGVASWFSCTQGTGGCGNPAGCGCGATTGYQQFLAADDDNGSLADGTPHMGAIFTAFNRHGVACGTPTNTTAGCAGTPTQVPVVTASSRNRGIALSWTASAGATGYRVYRTEGVFACSFGKELVATVTGTSYLDPGLKNGREYYYQVVPMGAADECFQVASTCTAGTPGTASLNPGASATLQMLTGDGDAFLDNCETARLVVPVNNLSTAQTNVRIASVTSPSHPGEVTLISSLPVAVTGSLANCGAANGNVDFSVSGLAAGETLVLEVGVTSDEMAGDVTTVQYSYTNLERDFQNFPTRTFNFDTNAEGWATQNGVFQRDSAGGGASGTPFYMESSSNLDDQCDVVRSPVLRLTASSTMELFTNYNIEAFSSGQWWDRANVAIVPVSTGTRAVLTPSSGRGYQASGTGGVCGLDNQAGWAGVNASWASSTFNTTALQTGTFAGQLVQLEMRYGTDSSVNNFGFRFDQLTLTNADFEATDAQADVCGNQETLSVNKTGAGSGTGTVTSNPAGIDCGATCSADFAENTVVTLTATPNGTVFTGWSGEGCSGTGTCVVTMSQARNVTANFELACVADSYEPDNTCATASVTRRSQNHTLCDEDWVSFTPLAGATYRLETSALFGGADTTLALHQSCGGQLAFDDNGAGGQASRIEWTAATSAPLQLRVRNAGDVYGLQKGYRLSMTCTSAVCNIFANGFESGDTSAWSADFP